MLMDDYLKGDSTAVRHCPSRGVCPLGALCEKMTRDEEEYPLFPTLLPIDRGQLLWTDPHSEQRVFVIKSGVFSCVSSLEQDKEVPFALFGCGHAVGLSELYIPRMVGKTYYMRALTHATVCSLPAKPLRRQIESAPAPYSLGVISVALTNISSASYSQAKAMSKPLLADRLAMVLIRLRDLAARERRDLREVHITHGELAALVASDRASVTRALHKMEQDGLVEAGYRSIVLKPDLDELKSLHGDACAQFHLPPAL